MGLKYLHSNDYHNLLNNVIENELITVSSSNNETLWIAMGNQLEIEGVEKSQISTIIRKDIEDKLWEKEYKEQYAREEYRYCNTKYFEVMRSNGWTNPFMARNVKSDFDPFADQKIVPYINPKMKSVCYDLINLCRILIDKSKDGTLFEKVYGEKKMNEWYMQMHTVINNCKNAIDHKTKVPKNTELLLLECLATILGSVNKCAQIFMNLNLIRLKEQGKFFTTKQATKFQKGMKQSQLHILKPTSRDTAIYLDYTGIQCNKCTSYRVRQKLDSYKLECYDCDNILPPSYHISKCIHCKVPLYKERLLHIVKTKRCDNCNEIVDLPQELVEYAKS